MTKIVFATNNPGKIKEIKHYFSDIAIDLIAQSELGIPPAKETGTTFVENAIIKARNAAAIANLPAIADDSGLVVDALGGEPGVYSARYGGLHAKDAENNKLLLARLANIPEEKRCARFICVLVYLRHKDDPNPIICHGIWEGYILKTAEGSQGFGYDPIFKSIEYPCSAAKLSIDVKNKISHRGRALKLLLSQLKNE